MKIAFFYPAKLLLAEFPGNWVLTPIPGAPLPFATLDRYPWYCTKAGKVKSNPLSEGQVYLLLEIEAGTYIPLTATGDASALIDRHAATLADSMKAWKGYLADPARYEAEQTEKREKIKAEREAANKEQEERNARRAEAAQQAYLQRLASFAGGVDQLPLEDFERACKEHYIKMPIQTVGWMRENVKSVGRKGATLTGSTKHNSPHFWQAVHSLFDALQTVNA